MDMYYWHRFVSNPGFYSLYPTFVFRSPNFLPAFAMLNRENLSLFFRYSELNETSYRPTNEDCLMRVVTSPNFCKACTEKLWLNLLERVDFIDDIKESCVQQQQQQQYPSSSGSGWSKVIDLHLLPLAHLRKTPVGPDESYTITWKKDGSLLPRFTNKTRIELDSESAIGEYNIKVKFATEEIRLKSKRLVSGVRYAVKTKCGEA